MNIDERLALQTFLQREFAQLGVAQEAKWVLEELAILDNCSAHERAESILLRRKKGEPLAYILGHWDFRSLKLSVGPGVLIPRPETEELVGHVLEYVAQQKMPLRIADLGSGSGAIAYSLVAESSTPVEVYAVEKSPTAFSYLEKNRQALPTAKQGQVHLLQGDWTEVSLPKVDIIVSNPPYVSVAEYAAVDPGVKLEPRCALVPEIEANPMSAYESILRVAARILRPGGAIFFEFGPAQEALWAPYLQNFQWRTFKDLSGKPRVLYAFDFVPLSR